MDPATLSATAMAAWTLLQPYLPIMATKTAEKLGSELPDALGKVWDALKGKLVAKPHAKESLADLLKNPKDPDLQAAFRVQIKKVLDEDPAFAEEFKRLVEGAGAQINVQVRNGAAAIGDGAKAVGKGGVIIGGDAQGNIIITGNDNDIQKGSR